MKPSPPKKPDASFFWKAVDSSTPLSAARNAPFWAMTALPGPMSRETMLPGTGPATATNPAAPLVVNSVKKKFSLVSIDRARLLRMPPLALACMVVLPVM